MFNQYHRFEFPKPLIESNINETEWCSQSKNKSVCMDGIKTLQLQQRASICM